MTRKCDVRRTRFERQCKAGRKVPMLAVSNEPHTRLVRKNMNTPHLWSNGHVMAPAFSILSTPNLSLLVSSTSLGDPMHINDRQQEALQ